MKISSIPVAIRNMPTNKTGAGDTNIKNITVYLEVIYILVWKWLQKLMD